jgi:hypothetical protein
VNSWKVILATLVIFGAGVVTGGLLVRRSDRIPVPHFVREPELMRRPPSPAVMRLEFLRRIQRDLDLSPDQKVQIDRILHESQERAHKLTEPIAPQLRAEMKRAKDEFRAVLTADQSRRFDQILSQPHPRDQHHQPPLPGTNRQIPPGE